MTSRRPTAPYRVVCVGNRFVSGDDAGPRIYDHLARRPAPRGVAVVDGGLLGLDLACLVEGARRVVFVDAVEGFGRPGETTVLTEQDLAGTVDGAFGHGDGLALLLRMLPVACDPPPGEVFVLAVEVPATDDALETAADDALRIAARGREALAPVALPVRRTP